MWSGSDDAEEFWTSEWIDTWVVIPWPLFRVIVMVLGRIKLLNYYRHFVIVTNYYTPKYAIWAFEQFDWFTLTVLWLHITLIHLLWHIQAAHIAWIYLLWWIRLIRQQSVVDRSSSGRCGSADLLAVMLQMMDSLNSSLERWHSQWLKQCWSFYCRPTWACLFTFSSFIDFAVFPRSASVSAC